MTAGGDAVPPVVDYGDAEGYHRELPRLRRAFEGLETRETTDRPNDAGPGS